MSTDTTFTAEQLLAMPDDGRRYELVEGVLHMMSPAGGMHGLVAARLAWLLTNHVNEHRLGEVFAAETGFRIATDPDTVRAPDAAFVSAGRFASVEDLSKYLPLAPDLVAEVISPDDRFSAVEAKAAMWLAAGTRMVLVVDPETQSIRVYRDLSKVEVLRAGDELDAGDAVPLWRLRVAEVFRRA